MDYKEKAKRYDEAIERAKNTIEVNQTVPDIVECVESLFPELKESEDERIRKWLIAQLKIKSDDTDSDLNIMIDKAISWLEKQGESYTKRDVDDAYLKGITDAKNEIEKQYEANYQIRKDIATFIFNYKGDIKDRAKWIDYLGIKASFVEKQGESNPYSGVSFEYNGHTWGMCARDNGVEIGIDSKLKAFVSLDKSFIYPIRNQPIIAPKSAMDVINEEKVDDKVKPKDYNDIDPHFGKPIDKVVPKFKVKFAGNEYNVLEVKDSAGITFYGIEDEPNHIDYVRAENCEMISGYGINDNGSLYPTETAVFLEQKPAWSEEDERKFSDILALLRGGETCYYNTPVLSTWLKSLKERVQPQPKQEWSEEDAQIALSIEQVMNCASLLNIVPEKMDKIRTWLKSLKDRVGCEVNCATTWKPSDEQIKALEHFVRSVGEIGYASPYDNNTKLLYSLLGQLKKLREE